MEMMEDAGLPTLSLLTSPDDAEARMRRALRVGEPGGAGTAQDHGNRGRPARHYAQDGDVPVVRLPGRKDHAGAIALAKAEEALQEERTAREKVEAALKQAQATIQTLQTKIVHAELAHVEELAAQRQTIEAVFAVKTELAVKKEEAPAPVLASEVTPVSKPVATPAPTARREKVKAAVVETDEAEPVEWWVAGWKDRLRR
jgi:hypothetical protein